MEFASVNYVWISQKLDLICIQFNLRLLVDRPTFLAPVVIKVVASHMKCPNRRRLDGFTTKWQVSSN